MNKYKVLILSLSAALLVGGSLYVYFSQKKISENATQGVQQDCSVTDGAVIKAVNNERAKIGVSPVVSSAILDQFSNERVTTMNGALDSHAGLKGSADKLGIYQYIGEDQQQLFGCHNSESRVMGFKLSEKHWASLMNPRYDEIGVGFYKNILNINLGDLK